MNRPTRTALHEVVFRQAPRFKDLVDRHHDPADLAQAIRGAIYDDVVDAELTLPRYAQRILNHALEGIDFRLIARVLLDVATVPVIIPADDRPVGQRTLDCPKAAIGWPVGADGRPVKL